MLSESATPAEIREKGGMKTNRRTRAESQWIVGQAYSRTYNTLSRLSRLQTICINNSFEITIRVQVGAFYGHASLGPFAESGRVRAYRFSFIIDRNVAFQHGF